MLKVRDDKLKGFINGFLDTERNVLIETKGEGFTDNYIRIKIEEAQIGENSIVKVRLNSYDEATETVLASIVNE